MKTLPACSFAVLALALSGTALAAPAQSGTKVDLRITTTLSMQGTAMAPRTANRTVCAAPGKLDPSVFAHEGGDCKVSDYREQGDTTTFHLACTTPEVVTSDGVFHRHPNGGFDGTMHTAMTAAGHAMTVETAYQGTPAGSCTPAAK